METPNGTMVFDETGRIKCPRCGELCGVTLGIVGRPEGEEVCPRCCRELTGLTHVKTTGTVVDSDGVATVRSFVVDLRTAYLSGH